MIIGASKAEYDKRYLYPVKLACAHGFQPAVAPQERALEAISKAALQLTTSPILDHVNIKKSWNLPYPVFGYSIGF